MSGSTINLFIRLFQGTTSIVIIPIVQMRNLKCSELRLFPKSHSSQMGEARFSPGN